MNWIVHHNKNEMNCSSFQFYDLEINLSKQKTSIIFFVWGKSKNLQKMVFLKLPQRKDTSVWIDDSDQDYLASYIKFFYPFTVDNHRFSLRKNVFSPHFIFYVKWSFKNIDKNYTILVSTIKFAAKVLST